MEYRYISGAELCDLIDGGKPGLVIVDVRDDDFQGGNIRGARNICSDDIFGDPAAVAEQLGQFSVVVVHCMLSQVRGPKSARVLSEAFGEMKSRPRPEVLVLEGGFSSFFSQFVRKRPDLFEGLPPHLQQTV